MDTEISINSSHSGTDGTSITVKVCQTARTLSAFTESCPYLSSFFENVDENWPVFTVTRGFNIWNTQKIWQNKF